MREVVIAGSELRQQFSDRWRALENIAPDLLNMNVCDVWIIAFDVHLDDG